MTDKIVRHVLLQSPGWPPGQVANGIVSTVAAKKKGLESLGVRCSVLSLSKRNSAEDRPNNVYCVTAFDRWPVLRRFHRRLAHRLEQMIASTRYVDGSRHRIDHIGGFESALAFIQKQHRCDLIEVEESYGLPGFIARRSHVPVVARLHGPWFLSGAANGVPQSESFHARVLVENDAIGHACGVSSPSNFVLRAVEEQIGRTLQFSSVIPNAVLPVAESLIWNPVNVSWDHLLFVGRFDRLKGADICLKAFVKVLEKRPQARLTVVGPDRGIRDETGCTRGAMEWLLAEIQPSRLHARISIRGQLSRDEIDVLRREAALTIISSRFENFPTTVLEAMAQGCPIVASRVGGIPEIVEHERNGLLSTPGDADDLAAKILCLLDNRLFSASLGKNALQDSLIKYSPTVVANQDVEFYQEVCSRVSAGSRCETMRCDVR